MSLNQKTRIDWADRTWNPVWGCTGGCTYCFARGIAKRFGMQVCGRDDFAPTWVEKNFNRPFPKKPSRIFVNSMSDPADWEPTWLHRVGQRILDNPQHLFLMLSKRPWMWSMRLPNVMTGYSVTRQADYDLLMRRQLANVSFLSLEPLLEPVDLWLTGYPAWVIVGAETGNRRERVVPEQAWLREIFGYCSAHHIPLFFKGSLRHLWPAGAYFPQEFPAIPGMKGFE